MKFFSKTKGAVSIFLVLILVPMMTVSALFVDAAKVKLASGVAESAGSLALNTALTDYDTTLKDMYGLFATAQNTDELFGKLEDYYRTGITSACVSDEDADNYVDKIMAQLGLVASDDNTADIINMELVNFQAQKLPGGHLANASVLKKQVVEFMKYRAPINTGLSFLSSLQSFCNLSKETELVDKRKDYYEAQQTVMESAQKAWDYINEYNKSAFVKDDNYFTNMVNNLNSYQGKYQEIHNKTIKDLYDTEDYKNFKNCWLEFGTEKVKVGSEEKEISVLYTNEKKTSKLKNYTEYKIYSDAKKASANNIKTALKNCYNASIEVLQARNSFLNYNNGTYGLQYIVQMNRENTYTSYIDAVKNYYDKYSILRHTVDYAEEGALDTEGKLWDNSTKSYNDFYIEVCSSYDGYVNVFNDEHRELNSSLQQFANSIGDKTNSTQTNSDIVAIYNEITSYRTTLSDAKTHLETAKSHLNDVLNGIKAGGTLATAKKAWSAVANDSSLNNDSMAKQDRAEISNLGEQFKPDDVQKLITRCDNIIAGLQKQIEEIDKFTYNGTKLCEISDYSTFEYIVKNKYGDNNLKNISTNESQLNNQISQWWNGAYSKGNVDISWTTQSASQPNLRVDKLTFYTYLYTHFHKSVFDSSVSETTNEVATEKSDEKQKYEDTKKALSDGASDKANTSQSISPEKEIKDQLHLPSENKGGSTSSGKVETGNSDAAEKTSSSLSGMFTGLSEALVSMGTTLRDDLYISDYVMNMFSYDAFEKEAKYNALANNLKSDYASVHKADTPNNIKLTSLTNESISKDKNFAYGGEVEYIIYGGSNGTNKAAAYGSIFAIRLGFNLVYAFTNSEIREGALAIATPISAATLGVIPAPLIQAAIIIGIGIAESSIDLMCLREGMKVPLYKNKDTWNISFSNLIQKIGSAAKGLVAPAVNKAIDTGTEYLDKWLDKTEEELNNLSADEVNKLCDSVNASFRSLINRESGIVMQKMTTLIENAMEEGLETEQQVVDYVDEKLNSWLSSLGEDKSGIAYQVKEKAVQTVCDAGGGYIKQVFTGIKNAASQAVSSASNALNDLLSGVRTRIENKVTSLVSSTLSDIKNEVKEAAKQGAGKLKESINGKINEMFSNSSDVPETSGVSSMLSFQYSDYLRLFLLIGLFTNQETMILRTADVIQVNMANKLTGNTNYLLENSAAYVKVNATIQVKPTLLALPLFAKVENNPKDNTNWYTIEYSSVQGY